MIKDLEIEFSTAPGLCTFKYRGKRYGSFDDLVNKACVIFDLTQTVYVRFEIYGEDQMLDILLGIQSFINGHEVET